MHSEAGARRTTNWLLQSLPGEDWWRLSPFLQPEVLPTRVFVERTGLRPQKVYFIETGVISVLETGDIREPIEVGVIGREGMTGIAAIADLVPQRDSYVQIEGQALAIESARFQTILELSTSLRSFVVRYIQAQAVQISLAASAGVRASVQQRLARKLLMYHDRTGTDDMPLTHESMALMLGVRRASVTNCIHNLEGERLIQARRGIIVIRDRRGLEKYCGSFYGVAEERYFAIMGDTLARFATKKNSSTL
jgi:CRP-like cAMP-binding protein